ncbi:transcription factor Adf-1-like [Macrobrachium rosenbergii]|uniref:transcription factor Adf-1-like n=1 Tax=Macrobrachium rosenbergii TaxID=79674 RepID=UPI0034D46632
MANFDEKLINGVYQHDILYDLSHKYYYDVGRKENAWEEISQDLNIAVKELKKRWNSLRDCYRKAINRKKTVSGQKAVNIPLWKYENQMAFLNAHFNKKRQQQSNLSAIEQNSLECEDNPQETGEDETSFIAEEASPHEITVEVHDSSTHEVEPLSPHEIAMPDKQTRKKKKSSQELGSSAHEILKTYLQSHNALPWAARKAAFVNGWTPLVYLGFCKWRKISDQKQKPILGVLLKYEMTNMHLAVMVGYRVMTMTVAVYHTAVMPCHVTGGGSNMEQIT